VFDPEPELITVVEGPTPVFRESPYLWFSSVYEGPEDAQVVMCELRTYNGQGILDRCLDAWREGRRVRLDYPDRLRMRQQVDVVAMRLTEVDEGPLLYLWVRVTEDLLEEEGYDEDEDDDGFDF
jgi:hypothetical protein